MLILPGDIPDLLCPGCPVSYRLFRGNGSWIYLGKQGTRYRIIQRLIIEEPTDPPDLLLAQPAGAAQALRWLAATVGVAQEADVLGFLWEHCPQGTGDYFLSGGERLRKARFTERDESMRVGEITIQVPLIGSTRSPLHALQLACLQLSKRS